MKKTTDSSSPHSANSFMSDYAVRLAKKLLSEHPLPSEDEVAGAIQAALTFGYVIARRGPAASAVPVPQESLAKRAH